MPDRPDEKANETAKQTETDKARRDTSGGTQADNTDQSKARPSSDRHATETAAGRYDGIEPAEHKTR